MRDISFRHALLLLSAAMACGCAPLPAKDDPWISRDKYYHAATSAAIAAVGAKIARDRDYGRCDAFRAGFELSLTVGVTKEFIDQEFRKKGWSWRDLAWDTGGAALGSWLVSQCR